MPQHRGVGSTADPDNRQISDGEAGRQEREEDSMGISKKPVRLGTQQLAKGPLFSNRSKQLCSIDFI